ncbi:MAG: hypothetical protein GNW80_03125 [Asgard group archaeon]|nr:hypothetical protein [Asgard group archaeon]
MVNNKTLSITIGGLGLTFLGGIFAFIYLRGTFSFSIWPIIAIVGIISVIVGIVVIYAKKRKTQEDLPILASSQSEFANYTEKKYQTCFWCGFPLKKHSEFCPDCGKRILRCTVCKLPISFGDEIGKCSLCESKGHFAHLFEWVKTKGTCPHCLQRIPTQAIIEASEIK